MNQAQQVGILPPQQLHQHQQQQQQQQSQARPPTDREQVSFSVKSAETFVSAYYAATDSPNRVRLVPLLYSPTASIVWNGTPVPPAAAPLDPSSTSTSATAGGKSAEESKNSVGGLAALLSSMPGSKHEVATFDAHPVGCGIGADGIPALRSMLIHVSGTVQHHTPAAALPPSNAPKSASTSGGSSSTISAEAMLALPRMFSQSFVLVDGGGEAEGGVRVVEERRIGGTGPVAGGGGVDSAAGTQTQTLARTARWFVQSDSFRFVG
ncbi:hypothetical protein V8E36_003920 [Tilletia maclaganii]